LQKDPQVMTTEEKEAFLSEEREYLGPVEDMNEVIKVMQFVTGPLHNAIRDRLESTILSEGEVFMTALMAAAGKYADMTNSKRLSAALEQLVADIETGKDPLALDAYGEVYRSLKSGRGRKIRSIICAAFLEYFRGDCKQLTWASTARVYE